jgi:hypothetical protein
MGMPESESSETKLCRISRGVQSFWLRSALLRTARKERRTLCASSSVPTLDANTRSLSCCLLGYVLVLVVELALADFNEVWQDEGLAGVEALFRWGAERDRRLPEAF